MDTRTALIIALMLLTAVTIAGHSILQRLIRREEYFSKREVLISQNFVGVLIFAPLALIFEPSIRVPTPNLTVFWVGVAITTCANVIIQWANIQAISLSEASRVAPIRAMTPGIVVFVAMALGEYPSILGYAGIFLIMSGNYAHLREGAGWRSYFEPLFFWKLGRRILLAFFRSDVVLTDDEKGLGWAYLSAICGTIGLVGDSLTARSGSVTLGFTIHLVVLGLVFAVIVPRDTIKETGAFLSRLKSHGLLLVGMGLIFGTHVLLPLLAFRLAPVAYIGSLKRLWIIVAVLLAWMILGEKKALRRLIPATIVTIGAVILVFDPAQEKIIQHAFQLFK